MSTVYLHIGTPKTGTSAIQAFLGMEENRRVLEKKGFSFPLFENFKEEDDAVLVRNAHTLIYGVYIFKKDYSLYEDLREDFYEKVRKILDSGKDVILSDESIWHICLQIDSFFERIYKKISGFGHELKIIVYLRRQDQLLESYWRYKVMIPRRHLKVSFPTYVKNGKYKYFPLDYYTRLCEIGDEIGGNDNIIVRAYEQEQYYGEEPTIVSDFLHCLGLELTDDFANADIKRNLGIDYACCEVKRRMNEIDFMQSSDMLRKYMVEISEENKAENRYQTPTLFSKEGLDAFMGQYEESNKKTAETFLHREDGRLFYRPLTYPEIDPAKLVGESDRDLICARIMKKMADENRSLRNQLKKEEETSGNGFMKKVKRKLKG